jgi:hypothetical protein
MNEDIQREAREARERMLAEQSEHTAAWHADCVSDPDGRFSTVAHTHEGETGWWLFPSEVAEREIGRPGPRTMARRHVHASNEDEGRLSITEAWAYEDGRQAGRQEILKELADMSEHQLTADGHLAERTGRHVRPADRMAERAQDIIDRAVSEGKLPG